MSEFHDVVEEFPVLIQKFNFKLPKKLWYKSLVAFSKQLDGIFFCYIIARVWEKDGSLETTLWVGPINRPDDGLEKLSANIKVQIGYTQNLDETFFRNCESKIISLIEADDLEGLLKASKRELLQPSKTNKRFEVYTKYELPFFYKLLNKASENVEILKSRKVVHNFVEELFSQLTGESKSYFEKIGLKVTQDIMQEFCYVYTL
jgi:hypothetical protein